MIDQRQLSPASADTETLLALELSLAKQRIRVLEDTVRRQEADIARILRLIGALR